MLSKRIQDVKLSKISLRVKLYNSEDLAFSGICYSTVNVVYFNVISKADKQIYALQESVKEDGLSFETICLNNASRVQNTAW